MKKGRESRVPERTWIGGRSLYSPGKPRRGFWREECVILADAERVLGQSHVLSCPGMPD